jgi:hypothetical protein
MATDGARQRAQGQAVQGRQDGDRGGHRGEGHQALVVAGWMNKGKKAM